MYQNDLEGFSNTDNKAPHTVSASVGLGRGTKMCISNKFLGDADSAGPGATL